MKTAENVPSSYRWNELKTEIAAGAENPSRDLASR